MRNYLLFFALLTTLCINGQNVFPSFGNVGIGTSNPGVNLEILGNSSPQLRVKSNAVNANGWFDIGIATCNGCFSDLASKRDVVFRGYGRNMIITNKNGGNITFGTAPNSNNDISSMVIHKSGNISIGTNSFSDGLNIYKLSVDGKVRANSVKVYTSWADYVFDSDYLLPTLDEVENFIKLNGHLKDIPSAKEVESNGIDLGDMNKLLLQKIEELTLYIIEMKKEIIELKKSTP